MAMGAASLRLVDNLVGSRSCQRSTINCQFYLSPMALFLQRRDAVIQRRVRRE
mgnify:CR=1 FL=1|jgi:hypothetical protein